MKKIAFILTGLVGLSAPAFADDNIAKCEIVVQQPVFSETLEEGEAAPMIATFLPAEDFIFSVFGGEEEHVSEVNGQKIQGLMCVRSNLVPTEFDLKLIKTGVPLFLSQDFDADDSALMIVNLGKDAYEYTYDGPKLSADDQELLDLRLNLLNTDLKEAKK